MRANSVLELLQNASKDTLRRNPHLAEEAKLKQSKKAKYGNEKVVVDNITFDSKREANYYSELKFMKDAGEILDFERQVDFVLIDGYEREENGKLVKVRPVKIRVDFKVYFHDGRIEVHDPKGFKTKEYKIKKKAFEGRYPNIKFVEI